MTAVARKYRATRLDGSSGPRNVERLGSAGRGTCREEIDQRRMLQVPHKCGGSPLKPGGPHGQLFAFVEVLGEVLIALPSPFECVAPERNVPRLPDL
jgi:hypothetical protein